MQTAHFFGMENTSGKPDERPSPWHAGERALHARIGLAEKLERAGRVSLRDFMPDQHRLFFAQLPFLVMGSVDEGGSPWASLLAGLPGFASSPDPKRLDIDLLPFPGDPLLEALKPGARVGVLGIELPTRRRNRMNGRVIAVDDTGFSIAVDLSFGNCPQYIHRRDYLAFKSVAMPAVEQFQGLAGSARALIEQADTFFIASFAPGEGTNHGVDISHRGGPAGFLRIAGDGAITVPDYSGNRFFNTLGNLAVNPKAGLLFNDFSTGDVLQLTGRTEIVWEGAEVESLPGAERLWRFFPSHGQWLRGAMPLRFSEGELWPLRVHR
jgi:predicted pyridoxine 5'-phosphate oxidase superfamily flavin-nucleotide-binding protein